MQKEKSEVTEEFKELIYIQIASMIAYTLLIVMGLLIVTYRIKNLPDEFSITRELAVIMIIVILHVLVYIVIVMIMYATNDFEI